MFGRKLTIGISALLATMVLAAAVMLSGVALPSTAQAQDEPATPGTATPGTVTVVGEGTVSIDPDIADATVGVEVVRPTVQEAVAEAREVMQAVLDALAEAGVAEEDIQTSGYNIWAERNFGPPQPMEMSEEGNGEEQVRYHVNNNVQITIRDLDNISSILDAAIDAGANNIYGVNFSLDDPSVVESEARQRAVENAQAKAEELANLTGTEVGSVVSLSEVIGEGGGYFGGNFAQAGREGLGGGGAGPIAPGQLELTMQLQITYELE